MAPTERDRIVTKTVTRYREYYRAIGVDAEDIRQEVELRLLTKPPAHDTPAFLTVVARTAILDACRAHWGRDGWNDYRKLALLRAGPIPVQFDEETGVEVEILPAPERPARDPFLITRLSAALATLAPRQARVVWRNVVEEESLADIARDHDRSLSWAFQQRNRGLALLRRSYESALVA